MNILFIGDVVSKAGVEKLTRTLPKFKKEHAVDIAIVNGENASVGNGLLPQTADEIFTAGADCITGGNHTFRRRELYDYLEHSPFCLRPANYKPDAPGKGTCIIDKGFVRVGVVNLLGTVFMEPLENPFDCADRVLRELEGQCDLIFVDFHAEATAEKRALGFYLDGRAAAVVGTHTHVQTADEQILPHGTAYITDLGMTGPVQSVLGVTPELAIEKLRTNLPVRFKNPEGESRMQGLLISMEKNGEIHALERVCV